LVRQSLTLTSHFGHVTPHGGRVVAKGKIQVCKLTIVCPFLSANFRTRKVSQLRPRPVRTVVRRQVPISKLPIIVETQIVLESLGGHNCGPQGTKGGKKRHLPAAVHTRMKNGLIYSCRTKLLCTCDVNEFNATEIHFTAHARQVRKRSLSP
jgi:hypothetical protein